VVSAASVPAADGFTLLQELGERDILSARRSKPPRQVRRPYRDLMHAARRDAATQWGVREELLVSGLSAATRGKMRRREWQGLRG
jgi:hypothetical protein